MYETNKLRGLFNGIHEKFLKAIDHMEFHPTLGKEKKLVLNYISEALRIQIPV